MRNDNQEWVKKAAKVSIERVLPRLQAHLNPADTTFEKRLRRCFPQVFRLLLVIYGSRYDFFYHLEHILITAAQLYTERPARLKALDQQREHDLPWFQTEQMIGAFCYVEQFAGTLNRLRAKLPYLEELKLNYLHLMPLFRTPENSDGGYAVSSFREINPALGTMDELRALADELRDRDIDLVLDFVFNHTSDEHDWALKARSGDEFYRDFYRFFPDRALPDQYAVNLREIFPDQAPGNFTYLEDLGEWVWTTFRPFQWDLNYENPDVFRAILGDMLFLANQGIAVLRLDAVPFIWKEMGTSCENLPQTHTIIQAYNALTRIVCPGVLFKSEAIVHPRDVASYIGWEECPISYNPTLMVELWEALATREVKLLRQSMQSYFAMPDNCAWINYARSHDDIGWGFADEDAAAVGINGYDHRQFLNAFYTGKFPGSFAKGEPFNYNPQNQDMRISGSTASLAGLERAIELNDDVEIEHAIRRIVLLQSIVLSAGGIPLFSLGDEVGTTNDYSYRDDPARADDNRWLHRPRIDWDKMERRHDSTTIEGRIFQQISRLIDLRRQTPAIGGDDTRFFDTRNAHIFGYVRSNELLVLCNFSETRQAVAVEIIEQNWNRAESGMATDLITGQTHVFGDWFTLEPLNFVWLLPVE
jgi:glycosidase